MRKGQLVKVKAIVRNSYEKTYGWVMYSGNEDNHYYKSIYRKEERLTAIFVGYSHMNEGIYTTVGEFQTKKQHKVCVLEPFNTGDNRYYKPVRALLEDVEVLGGERQVLWTWENEL